jgi:hypothetical protein
MRVVVAQPPPADPDLKTVLAVGAVRRGGQLSVVVKMTFVYAGSGSPVVARPAIDPEPLSLDAPSRHAQASPRELFYASDFVPEKPRPSVLLVGHAYAARPVPRIEAGVSAAGVALRFAAVAGKKPAARVPLDAAHLVAQGGESAPVGPLASSEHDAGDPDDDDDERGEGSGFQSAARAQQGRPIRADEAIELTGLSREEQSLVVELPGLAPRVFTEDGPVELRADTLWIDTDRERLVVVWRGRLPAGTRRIVASLERDRAPRSIEAIRRELPRGSVGRAIEEEDLRPDAPAPSPEELLMARYESWGQEAAEPSIPLEVYAATSAELAEAREPRGDVLQRRRLDEGAWALEERAWLEKMARGANKGDGTLAVRYGELFMAAQDRLAGPGEAARTLADYAAIRAAMERAGDPSPILQQRSMSLSAWMRLDRRFTAEAAADPAVQAELDRLVQAEHEAAGPVPDDDDDEDDVERGAE